LPRKKGNKEDGEAISQVVVMVFQNIGICHAFPLKGIVGLKILP